MVPARICKKNCTYRWSPTTCGPIIKSVMPTQAKSFTAFQVLTSAIQTLVSLVLHSMVCPPFQLSRVEFIRRQTDRLQRSENIDKKLGPHRPHWLTTTSKNQALNERSLSGPCREETRRRRRRKTSHKQHNSLNVQTCNEMHTQGRRCTNEGIIPASEQLL